MSRSSRLRVLSVYASVFTREQRILSMNVSAFVCARLWRTHGDVCFQVVMFTYVSLEQRVLKDHPLREIRLIVNVFKSLNDELGSLYSALRRPSIAPEYLLRALLLEVLFLRPVGRQLVAQPNPQKKSCGGGYSDGYVLDDGIFVILAHVDSPSIIGFFLKLNSQLDLMSTASGVIHCRL